ncbi:hypothetical protein OSTOST_14125 [Ostertagia ostertagi]
MTGIFDGWFKRYSQSQSVRGTVMARLHSWKFLWKKDLFFQEREMALSLHEDGLLRTPVDDEEMFDKDVSEISLKGFDRLSSKLLSQVATVGVTCNNELAKSMRTDDPRRDSVAASKQLRQEVEELGQRKANAPMDHDNSAEAAQETLLKDLDAIAPAVLRDYAERRL